jgi:hypothetical protein
MRPGWSWPPASSQLALALLEICSTSGFNISVRVENRSELLELAVAPREKHRIGTGRNLYHDNDISYLTTRPAVEEELQPAGHFVETDGRS